MENYKFKSLTPKSDIDISSYEEALDFALLNKKVTNIAVTGPYGAGKSSVIETYKKKNKNKNFMNISLTHFEGSESADTNILEGKIVNQLLHQIDYDKIPQTIFKIKNNTKKWKMWLYTAFLSIFFSSMILTFRFSEWKKYLLSSFIDENSKEKLINVIALLSSKGFNLISLVVFMCSCVYLVYSVIKLQLNKQLFKKITVKGNEVEIFNERHESYFDKFMNDVIYLFTSSEKDIIIFEDLDRFENSTIYERLYEINLLINKRLLADGKGRQIKFIYLIKDDAFTSKDRAKLFDMIIPIVPVIDSSNSFEQFIQVFEDSGISEDFDNKNLRKLSLYIDDMRLLKNISNEYYIYKKRLSKITLENNKLLTTIIYKNLFPKDFSYFQLGQGFINKVFLCKNDLIQEEMSLLTLEIEKLEKEIMYSDKEMLNSVNELDALFLKVPLGEYYEVNGKTESDFIERSYFIDSIKANNYEIQKKSYSARTTNYYGQAEVTTTSSTEKILGIFEGFKKSEEYCTKLERINNKNSINNNKLLSRKKQLIFKKNDLSSKAISDLIPVESDSFFNDKKLKTKDMEYLYESPYFDLIIFIIREGLIDENYNDYLTYFYDNSLNKNDKEFLRGLYDRKPKKWNYELENPERLTSDISFDEISRFSILNIDLLFFYLNNESNYNDEIFAMFNVLKRFESNEFIIELYSLFKKDNRLEYFATVLDKQWENFFEEIILNNIDKRNEIEEFIYVMFFYSTNRIIKLNNSKKHLLNFIENSTEFSDYLNLNNIDIDKYLFKLKEMNLEFVNIKSDQLITKDLIQGNLFRMSTSNLIEIFKVYEVSIGADFYNSNLSSLLGNDELKKTIYDSGRLNKYIEVYMSFADENIHENGQCITTLLNNDNLLESNAIDILNKLKLYEPIEKITDVNISHYKKLLFEKGNILINGDNILEYYIMNDNDITLEMKKAINYSKDLISFDNVINDYESSLITSIFETIVVMNDINTNQYLSMLKSLGRVYSGGFNLDVDIDKIKKLIDDEIIKITAANLKSTINQFPKAISNFVQKDIDVFIEIFEETDIFDSTVLLELIKNNELKSSEIKRLIDLYNTDISVTEHNYSDIITEYIIGNKFSVSDLQPLLKEYSKKPNKIKKIFYLKVLENLKLIIEEEYLIDKMLLIKLLNDINVDNRDILFVKYIKHINIKELEYFIKKLGFSEDFINVLKGKRPKFDINETNRIILEEYKLRGYINEILKENEQFKVNGKKLLK